jgi:DNA polymerase-3 subunit epsilon
MPFWKYLLSLERRRNWLLDRSPEGPLREYYAVPFPDIHRDWRNINYLALDFETTGIDEKSDEILSVGFTTIRGPNLCLTEAYHCLIRPTTDIPEETAILHGIMHDQAADAEPIEVVLPRILRALAGKVLLAHYAPIETRFLQQVCRQVYGFPFLAPTVDTLHLEARRFQTRNRPIKKGQLRLANVRERYGLPRYPAHNALADAIAAGELFLAQAVHIGGNERLNLRELMSRT